MGDAGGRAIIPSPKQWAGSYSAAVTFRPMKRRSMCRCTMGGADHQAYLWQYGRPGGGVVFDFRLGGARRAKEIPGTVRRHFADRRLWRLRSRRRTEDRACRMLGARAKEVLLGVQLNPNDAAATRIVGLIDDLFGIDAQRANRTWTTSRARRYVWSGPSHWWR